MILKYLQMRWGRIAVIAGVAVLVAGNVFASVGEGAEGALVERITTLVFQLSLIIFAAWVGGLCFEKFGFPSVLGEIIAGVIIGPYCLGGFSLPEFAHGIFPLQGGGFPVSVELYSLATIASIILLFLTGLETDLETFLQFSVAGSVVGISGVVVSFVAGDILGVLMSDIIFNEHYGFFHTVPLFLGVISTATSVGITARILSEKRKMHSPEGVTILSAAVIDDVLGIIILAVILGVAKSGDVGFKEVSFIALKAIGIWLGFTFLGLKFACRITANLKKINNKGTIAVLSLALALLLAGIFEKAGLAMIIGAYIMGLSLSKTDLSFIIQEKLEILRKFLVPVFFCVMGMLINLEKMASWNIVMVGLLYVVFAVLGKLVGCSIPAMFLNFNLRGALRVGVGMVPRGEVALIMAGIGLSLGIINDVVFSVAMIMTFITTLVMSPVLDKMLESEKPVLRKEPPVKKWLRTIKYDMPNPETAELLLAKVIDAFEEEGFFVHRMNLLQRFYNIRKDQSVITLRHTSQCLTFDCLAQDAAFIHTLFYEVIAEVEYFMKRLQSIADKSNIGKRIFTVEDESGIAHPQGEKRETVLSPLAVEIAVKGQTKEAVLVELVDLLVQSGQVKAAKIDDIVHDLKDREAMMSTGMQDGIALPHAKTKAVIDLVIAVGISQQGVDFNSFDKKPSRIFVLTLIPKVNPQPYLQTMAEISKFLVVEKNRHKILSCETKADLFSLLSQHL
ncbi:MAG: cation:proton antiporter [Candidatus Omnitrophica bacterium]|nr:cation:proton antiporter [Candidatus Omnitrophota bacterium]